MKPSFSEWSESDDEPYEDNEPVRKRILRKGGSDRDGILRGSDDCVLSTL